MAEFRPEPRSEHVRARMRSQARAGTRPEMVIRRQLFAMGLRYRVGMKVPSLSRRTIDIAFPKQRVAVFVDGCFWHRCPVHHIPPKNNSAWWLEKLDTNVSRDRDTDSVLRAAGWTVVRVWEHEDPHVAVERVVDALR